MCILYSRHFFSLDLFRNLLYHRRGFGRGLYRLFAHFGLSGRRLYLDFTDCRSGLFRLSGLSNHLLRLMEIHFHLRGLYAGTDDLMRDRLCLGSGARCRGRLISALAGLSGRSLLSCAA